MAKELSRYLTALDAAFLYFEKPTEAMHIGSCMVYEGRMERQELIELLEKRLHLTPRYRQRVVFPPFAANHPFWIDDPEFDMVMDLPLGTSFVQEMLFAPGTLDC